MNVVARMKPPAGAAVLVSLVALGSTACSQPSTAPNEATTEVSPGPVGERAPIVDDAGQHVGWVDADDLASTGPGELVDVVDNGGNVVGHFRTGADGGFVPLG